MRRNTLAGAGVMMFAVIIAASASAQDRTTTTTTRPTTTVAPAPPPLIIPGGGLVATPLKAVLNKVVCQVSHKSGGDKMFVVTAAIQLNWEKLWLSKVTVNTTNVYEDMDPDDLRVPNLGMWGLDGSATPIADPNNVILLVGVFYHDDGNITMSKILTQAKLLERINSLHPGDTYPQIVKWMTDIFHQTMYHAVTQDSDDIYIGGAKRVPITQEDLGLARVGNVVTKKLEFYDSEGRGIQGKYIVYVQLSK
jgi:hypothetical protein